VPLFHRLLVPGLVLVVACKGGEPPAPAVAATPPPREPIVSTVEVARFELSLSPRRGKLSLKKGPSPRSAFDYAGAAVEWEVCDDAECASITGDAGLFTDQAGVLFHDFDGTCYSNDGVVACPVDPPCNVPGMFCAPLQVVSRVTAGGARGMVPDVIMQLSQVDDRPNSVIGCRDDHDWTGGLCFGSGKVDAPSSSLTSPIPGDPGAADPTYGCSYCYGNPARAIDAGLPGLQHGVLSGHEATLRGVNTAVVAMQLTSNSDYDVVMTLRQAVPTFDAPATQLELENGVTCARGGLTRVTVRGGGFGPPGACLEANLSACPLSGPPAPGYQMIFDRIGGGTIAATDVAWSDGEVSGVLPASARAGSVRLVTPQAPGGVATSEIVKRCLNAEAAFVAGATPAMSGGGINARVEMGRGVRPTTATGTDVEGQPITMKIGRTVAP
jgi:hypothetical protein